MKVLSSIPTSATAISGNWTAVNSVDHADAVNDVTTFSVATIPDLAGNTYYANAADPYQLFTAWTYLTQPSVGIRSSNALYPYGPNDGTPIYFEITSVTSNGSTVVYSFFNSSGQTPVIGSPISVTGFDSGHENWNITNFRVQSVSPNSGGNGSFTVSGDLTPVTTYAPPSNTVYANQPYANSGGDYFVYVNDISKFRENQIVAILEGLQAGKVPYTPSATSTDSFYSEWIEYAASGLIPTIPYKQTVDPIDFPISSLMLPQGYQNVSTAMSPNISFYNPPANKYLGQFLTPTSSSIYTNNTYLLGQSPTPYNVGNGLASPIYISSSGDPQAIANLASILPDNTASSGYAPTVSSIIIGYFYTEIQLSSTAGFATGQTVTLSMLPTTTLTPAPMGWNAGKIISINGNVITTDLSTNTTRAALITISTANFNLPNANAGFSGVVVSGDTIINNVSATRGVQAGMVVNDVTSTSNISSPTYVDSVSSTSGQITMSNVAIGTSSNTGAALYFPFTADLGGGDYVITSNTTVGVNQTINSSSAGFTNALVTSYDGMGGYVGITVNQVSTTLLAGASFTNSATYSISISPSIVIVTAFDATGATVDTLPILNPVPTGWTHLTGAGLTSPALVVGSSSPTGGYGPSYQRIQVNQNPSSYTSSASWTSRVAFHYTCSTAYPHAATAYITVNNITVGSTATAIDSSGYFAVGSTAYNINQVLKPYAPVSSGTGTSLPPGRHITNVSGNTLTLSPNDGTSTDGMATGTFEATSVLTLTVFTGQTIEVTKAGNTEDNILQAGVSVSSTYFPSGTTLLTSIQLGSGPYETLVSQPSNTTGSWSTSATLSNNFTGDIYSNTLTSVSATETIRVGNAISTDIGNSFVTSVSGSTVTLATALTSGGFYGIGTPVSGTASQFVDEFYVVGNAMYFNNGAETASWSSGATTISLSSTAGVYAGMKVQGLGIPFGTAVSSVGTGTITIDHATTSAGTSGSTRLSITSSVYSFPYYSTFTNNGYIVGGFNNYFPNSQANGSFLSGEIVTGTTVGTNATINNDYLQDEFVSGKPSTFTATATTTSYTATSVSSFQKIAIGQLVSGDGVPASTYITDMDTYFNTVTLSNLPTKNGSLSFTTALFPAQTFAINGLYEVSGTSYYITPSTSDQFIGVMVGMLVYTTSGVNNSASVTYVSEGNIYLSKDIGETVGQIVTVNLVNGSIILSQNAYATDIDTLLTVNYEIISSNALASGATIENTQIRLNTSEGNKFDFDFLTAPYLSIDPTNNPNHGKYIVMPVVPKSIKTKPNANAISVATHTPSSGNYVNGVGVYANITPSLNFIGSCSVHGTSAVGQNPSYGNWSGNFTGWMVWGLESHPTNVYLVTSTYSDGGGVYTIYFTSTSGTYASEALNDVPMYLTPPVQVSSIIGLSVGQVVSSDATPFSTDTNGYSPSIIHIDNSAYTLSGVLGDTTSGSPVITNVTVTGYPANSSLLVGMQIFDGTAPSDNPSLFDSSPVTIVSVDGPSQITVSANATQTLQQEPFSCYFYKIYLGSYAYDAGGSPGYGGYSIPSFQGFDSTSNTANHQSNVFMVAGGNSEYGEINTCTLTVDDLTNLSPSPSSNFVGFVSNGYNGISNIPTASIPNVSVGDAVFVNVSTNPTLPFLYRGAPQGNYGSAYGSAFVSAIVDRPLGVSSIFLEDSQGNPYPIFVDPRLYTGSVSAYCSAYTPTQVAGGSRLAILEVNATKKETIVWSVDGSNAILGGNTTAYPNGDNQNAIYPIENTVSVYSAFTTPQQDGIGAGVIAVKGNIIGNHAADTVVGSYDEGDRYFGSDTVGDIEVLTPTTIGSLFGTTLATDVTTNSNNLIVNPLNNTSGPIIGGNYYDQFGNIVSQGAPNLLGITVSNCIVIAGENYVTAPQTTKDVTVGWLVTGTNIPKNTFVSAVRGSKIYLTNVISGANDTVGKNTTANITFTPQVWGVMVVGKGRTQETLIFNGTYTFLSGLTSGNSTSPISVPLASGQKFQYKHYAGEPVTVANITTDGFANQHAQGAPILGGAEDSVNLQGKQTLIADNTAGAISTLNSTTLLTSPTWSESGANGSASMNNRLTTTTPAGSTVLSIAHNDLFPKVSYDTVFNTKNFCPPEIGRVAGLVNFASGTSYAVPFAPNGQPTPQGKWYARIGGNVVLVNSIAVTDDTSLTPSGYLLVIQNGNTTSYPDGTPIHLKSLDANTTYNSLTVPHFYLNRSFSGVASTASATISNIYCQTPISGMVESSPPSDAPAGSTTFVYSGGDPSAGMTLFGDPAIQNNTVVTSVDTTTKTATLSKPFTANLSSAIFYFAYSVLGPNVSAGSYIQAVSGTFTNGTGSVSLVYQSLQPTYPTVNGNITLNIDASLYSTGGLVSTIYTTPQTCAIPSGSSIYLKYGIFSQTVFTSASVAIGDTSISVTPFNPSFNFVSSNVNNGTLTDTNEGVSIGTIGSFSLYAPLTKGQVLVLGSGKNTQQIIVHSSIPAFALNVPLEPFKPNYAYDDTDVTSAYTGNTTQGSYTITSFSGTPAIGSQLISSVFDTATFVVSVSGSTVTVSTQAISTTTGATFTVNQTTFTSPAPLTITSGNNYETVYPYTIPENQSDGTYLVQIASPTVNQYDVQSILAFYAPPGFPEEGDVRYIPQTDSLEKYDGEAWRTASIASVSTISAIQGSSGGGDKHAISLVDTSTNTVAASDTYVNQTPAQTS